MSHPSFAVRTAELRQARLELDGAGTEVGGVQIDAPNPAMFGKLVGSSVSDAEPFTTQQLNALILALAALESELGIRVGDSALKYDEVDAKNTGAALGICASLNGIA